MKWDWVAVKNLSQDDGHKSIKITPKKRGGI